MGLIQHVWPWDSQPQEATGVNADSPLSAGLVRLISPVNGVMFDAVSQRPIDATGQTSSAATAEGRGGTTTSNGNYWTFPKKSEKRNSITVGWLGLHTGGTTPITLRDGTTFSNQGGIFFWRNSGWDVRAGGSDFAAGGTFATNTLYAAATTVSASATQVYVRGQGRVVNGGAPGAFDLVSPWYLHSNGPDTAGGAVGSTLLLAMWDRPLSAQEVAEWLANPWQLFEPRRIWLPVSAGGGASVDLAATGGSGTLSASASSPAVAELSSTGGSGAFSGAASSPATATLDAAGSSGALSVSAGAGASTEFAATGGSGSLAAVAYVPAAASLAATGGSGSLSASVYPLIQASLTASGGSGSLAASAGSIVEASLSMVGGSGTLSVSATVAATASLNLQSESGTLHASAAGASPAPSGGWGPGAFGGGGGGKSRELLDKIARDAEELLEEKRRPQRAEPKAPQPVAGEKQNEVKRTAARPAPSVPELKPPPTFDDSAILAAIQRLDQRFEKLEALILADREAQRKAREQADEDAAVVKLLLG